MALAPSSGAATGDTVHNLIVNRDGTACQSQNDGGDHASIGTGIAFDGDELLISCWGDSSVTVNDPISGDLLEVHVITGARQLGALAYDAGRGVLYGCSEATVVGIVDLDTDTFAPLFDTAANAPNVSYVGCLDGLAYDASDDTFWSSHDVSSHVEHFTYEGALISSNNVSGGDADIAGGSSGIAVGGDLLYLANNGGSKIFEVPKDFSSSKEFAAFDRRIEDLECDNVTFAGDGVAVMWQQDAFDNLVNAFEIPDGSCKFGGGVDPEPEAEPCAASAGDPGILTEDTLGQTLYDSGTVGDPLVGNPDHAGPLSGPVNDGFDDTPLEIVGDEATCAASLFFGPDGDSV